MIRRTVRRSGGSIIFGLLLLGVGIYYFLRNTLGIQLDPIDSEAVWPIIVIALGALIVYRNVAVTPRIPDER